VDYSKSFGKKGQNVERTLFIKISQPSEFVREGMTLELKALKPIISFHIFHYLSTVHMLYFKNV
jgi:hypothetical protein